MGDRDLDQTEPRPAVIRYRVAGKIVAPYLVLVLVMAFTAIYLVTRTIGIGGRALNDAVLNHAMGSAMETLGDIQRQHGRALAALIDAGAPQLIDQGDSAGLQTVVGIVMASADLDAIQVTLVDGHTLAATGPIVPLGSGAPLFDRALSEGVPETGLSGAVTSSSVPGLYTARDVQLNGRRIAVVFAGTSWRALVNRLIVASNSMITLYDADGRPLDTGLWGGDSSKAMPMLESVVRDTQAGRDSGMRRGFVVERHVLQELVMPATLSGRPQLFVGTAVKARFVTDAASRHLIIGTWSVGVLIVLGAGLFMARSVARPLTTLAEAASSVDRGERTEALPVRSRDEIGVLTEFFNRRVLGEGNLTSPAVQERQGVPVTSGKAARLRRPLVVRRRGASGWIRRTHDHRPHAEPWFTGAMSVRVKWGWRWSRGRQGKE